MGTPYEWKELNFAEGDHKTPEHTALHPAGKVPVIDDDSFILFESGAICKYLCDKEQSELYPRDVQQRAVVDQWIDFSANHLGLAMSKVYFNRIIAPRFDIEVDTRSISEGVEWLSRYLPIVNEALTQHPYLTGDHLTLADITLLSITDLAGGAEVDLTPYAKLGQWRTTLCEEAFWKTCQA